MSLEREDEPDEKKIREKVGWRLGAVSISSLPILIDEIKEGFKSGFNSFQYYTKINKLIIYLKLTYFL